MKKLLLAHLIALTLILTGCEPVNWDVSTSGWKSWAEGTIVKKSYQLKTNSKTRRALCLELDNGDRVSMGILYEPERVKVGQKGTLYKYGSNTDETAWFRWMPTTVVSSSDGNKYDIGNEYDKINEFLTEIASLKAKLRLADKQTRRRRITQKYEWKPTFRVIPEAHTIVLITTEDGIITTAHIDNKKEWKLETNKDKLSGGLSLTNVKEWKEININ